MHFRVSHQSQCGLYQRTNQIACQKITKDGIYIKLETCQFTVRCSVKHFMAYYFAILPLPM